MYTNNKPIWHEGTLYDTGAHSITEADYSILPPEGQALYTKAVKQGKLKNTENGNNNTESGTDTAGANK